jgi:hypothetical protein
MTFTFQPATLDTSYGDTHAMLVFRDDRLLAVLSCLGGMHGDLEGKWFVETVFADLPGRIYRTFETLHAFEAWIAAEMLDSAR